MDSQSLAQQLVKDWQKPIYNFALRWFGDENHAADATQETFLVALRDLHQLHSPSKLKSWIFTVARRVMIRQARRKLPEILDSDIMSDGAGSSEQAMERERRERIDRELAKLPEELRTVLILHFFHDLSQVEIAAQLSIPRTTIQSQLKRGLDTLRTKLVACGVSYGV
ncbi:MAG: sigma-70 family RNA polymerase sigma factor, partial [Planctomycetota bacterium]|nr:sigma-70 family RNA polymerase sigma factor [Planctomycetota bacterium]